MGIKATDLIFTEVIKYLIKDLRNNNFLIRDILGDVLHDPLLKRIYGEREVLKFQNFLAKEIQVNIEHAIDAARLPAVAIRVGGGAELATSTGDPLGDGYHEKDININKLDGILQTPTILLGPITPDSYDSITGLMTFPSTISLAPIYEGMVVYDEVNQVAYPIVVVQDNFSLFIEPGSNPDLTNMTIRTSTPNSINIKRRFFTTEQITFVCISAEPVEVIYLYQILMYMIGRNRIDFFETKNFRVATTNFSPIYQISNEPPLVFARDISMTGQVQHDYIVDTSKPIQGINTDLRIADMQSPTSILEQVSNQSWEGEEDP